MVVLTQWPFEGGLSYLIIPRYRGTFLDVSPSCFFQSRELSMHITYFDFPVQLAYAWPKQSLTVFLSRSQIARSNFVVHNACKK